MLVLVFAVLDKAKLDQGVKQGGEDLDPGMPPIIQEPEKEVYERIVITNTIFFSITESPTSDAQGIASKTEVMTYVPTKIPVHELMTITPTVIPPVDLMVKKLPIYFNPGITVGATVGALLITGWIYTSCCWKPKALIMEQKKANGKGKGSKTKKVPAKNKKGKSRTKGSSSSDSLSSFGSRNPKRGQSSTRKVNKATTRDLSRPQKPGRVAPQSKGKPSKTVRGAPPPKGVKKGAVLKSQQNQSSQKPRGKTTAKKYK